MTDNSVQFDNINELRSILNKELINLKYEYLNDKKNFIKLFPNVTTRSKDNIYDQLMLDAKKYSILEMADVEDNVKIFIKFKVPNNTTFQSTVRKTKSTLRNVLKATYAIKTIDVDILRLSASTGLVIVKNKCVDIATLFLLTESSRVADKNISSLDCYKNIYDGISIPIQTIEKLPRFYDSRGSENVDLEKHITYVATCKKYSPIITNVIKNVPSYVLEKHSTTLCNTIYNIYTNLIHPKIILRGSESTPTFVNKIFIDDLASFYKIFFSSLDEQQVIINMIKEVEDILNDGNNLVQTYIKKSCKINSVNGSMIINALKRLVNKDDNRTLYILNQMYHLMKLDFLSLAEEEIKEFSKSDEDCQKNVPCKFVIKRGGRKGLKCGKIYCSNHKFESNTNDVNPLIIVKYLQTVKMCKNPFHYRLSRQSFKLRLVMDRMVQSNLFTPKQKLIESIEKEYEDARIIRHNSFYLNDNILEIYNVSKNDDVFIISPAGSNKGGVIKNIGENFKGRLLSVSDRISLANQQNTNFKKCKNKTVRDYREDNSAVQDQSEVHEIVTCVINSVHKLEGLFDEVIIDELSAIFPSCFSNINLNPEACLYSLCEKNKGRFVILDASSDYYDLNIALKLLKHKRRINKGVKRNITFIFNTAIKDNLPRVTVRQDTFNNTFTDILSCYNEKISQFIYCDSIKTCNIFHTMLINYTGKEDDIVQITSKQNSNVTADELDKYKCIICTPKINRGYSINKKFIQIVRIIWSNYLQYVDLLQAIRRVRELYGDDPQIIIYYTKMTINNNFINIVPKHLYKKPSETAQITRNVMKLIKYSDDIILENRIYDELNRKNAMDNTKYDEDLSQEIQQCIDWKNYVGKSFGVALSCLELEENGYVIEIIDEKRKEIKIKQLLSNVSLNSILSHLITGIPLIDIKRVDCNYTVNIDLLKIARDLNIEMLIKVRDENKLEDIKIKALVDNYKTYIKIQDILNGNMLTEDSINDPLFSRSAIAEVLNIFNYTIKDIIRDKKIVLESMMIQCKKYYTNPENRKKSVILDRHKLVFGEGVKINPLDIFNAIDKAFGYIGFVSVLKDDCIVISLGKMDYYVYHLENFEICPLHGKFCIDCYN